MDEIILVSYLVRAAEGYFEFHFRGFYKGAYISKIKVNNKGIYLKKSETYLLHLKKVKIFKGSIVAELAKAKDITGVFF